MLPHKETGEPEFKRSCKIDEDFLDRNYKSSPDGVFTFTLENMDKIDMKKVDSIKIEFSGSNIPFAYGDKLVTL